MQKEKIDEIWAILLITLGIFILLSLITFNSDDISLYSSPANAPVENLGGFVGAYISGILLFLMGVSAYIIPVLFLIWGINRFFKTIAQRLYTRVAGTIILILATSSLMSMIVDGSAIDEFRYGGTFGFFLSRILVRYCGMIGTYIILSALLLLSVVLATEFMIFPILKKIKDFFVSSFKRIKSRLSAPSIEFNVGKKAIAKAPQPDEPRIAEPKTKKVEYAIHKPQPPKPAKLAKLERPAAKPTQARREKIAAEYKLPPLELLDSPPSIKERKIKEDLKTNSDILESTLLDFDIEAKVVRVEQGPVITRYELEPAPGVKVNRITALNDNIALAMKAQSVRIVAPMPGRGTIGVEVPNSASSVVYFKEVLGSKEFKDSSSKLSLALGKDIAGNPVIADLADMPHLLIAGTTGSGKTVCVNCLIMSLLFSMRPEEVKFLMVDPKMVELAIFNGLPHLLCPVVTDAKKAAASLKNPVNHGSNEFWIFPNQVNN